MNLGAAFDLTTRLCGVVGLVQGLEFLRIAESWSDRGIWRWKVDESRFGFLIMFISPLLRFQPFFLLNILRISAAVSAIFVPNVFAVWLLLFIHFLTLVRWQGSFNGGSDAMNLVVLLGVIFALSAPKHSIVAQFAAGYIALQLLLSYFRAGIAKLREPSWRSGVAIKEFLLSTNYTRNDLVDLLVPRKALLLGLSWVIIIFEISFPVTLAFPSLGVAFTCASFFFHLGNVYLFGLNRFLWAWISAFPSLFYFYDYLNRLISASRFGE